MSYEITPLKGVGGIEFGMTTVQVRTIMGDRFSVFKRGSAWEGAKDDHPSDFYENEGILFYYDQEGYLEAIEFSSVASPTIYGIDLFELPIVKAMEVLRKLDPEAVFDEEGAISHRLSLAVWSPEAEDDPEAEVQSVLTGRAGYYGEA